MEKKRNWLVLMGLCLLLLLPLYVGAYYATVVSNPLKWDFKDPLAIQPTYRSIPGVELEWFFHPIHLIDRKLRPNTWYVQP